MMGYFVSIKIMTQLSCIHFICLAQEKEKQNPESPNPTGVWLNAENSVVDVP